MICFLMLDCDNSGLLDVTELKVKETPSACALLKMLAYSG